MTSGAVGRLGFYVRGLLAPFMEPDDPRFERIRASLDEYGEAIEGDAARRERERLRAKGEGMCAGLPEDHRSAHALFLLALLDDGTGLNMDGLPFCPSGFAQRYHGVCCDCET